MYMTEFKSKRDVIEVISNQQNCDDSCPFSEFCPRLLDAMMSEEKLCLIRVNYENEFDRFYNLYFGESEGLKNEMRASVYKIAQSACTPEEILTYFNAINKMSSAFYMPEKTGKADEITSVVINFDSIEGGKKKNAKSNVKKNKND